MAGFPFSLAPPERVRGRLLRAVKRLASTSVGVRLLRASMGAELGIGALAALPDSAYGGVPFDARPLAGRPPRAALAPPPSAKTNLERARWPRSASDLATRYRSGATTPRAGLEAALEAAAALTGALHGSPLLERDDAAARRDADAAGARYARGAPRGPLDGVPVAIKEELDVTGLHRRSGTSFLGAAPSAIDATCVARLRAAGAVLLGTTPMTEYGTTTFGHNPQRALPRNPHDGDRGAGGSSTGSAVAVAAGLCPIAVAADGGGSIRIPSSLCGVFGLKPTFGRISRAGDAFGGTMDHLGACAATALDLALFLDVCAGADPLDAATAYVPASLPGGDFASAVARGVAGLRIGVLAPFWEEADPVVAESGRRALAALERAGARLVPTEIPLAKHSTAIGYLTIGLEMYADLRQVFETRPDALGDDLYIFLASLSSFGATDYLDAQRLRVRLREQTAAALRDVDLLALPATLRTAPSLDDQESLRGLLAPRALQANCRTMMLGNLTGLPAASAPVGRDEKGLPIGLQLVGDAWDEATVLAALGQLERDGAATALRPRHHADLD